MSKFKIEINLGGNGGKQTFRSIEELEEWFLERCESDLNYKISNANGPELVKR